MRSKRLIVALLSLLITVFIAGNALAAGGLGVASNFTAEAPGQALVFGYYDTRAVGDGGAGLTDNYFTVTNVTDEYLQAHVRVRTGDKSIELLDFDVVLTPWDVFGFDIYSVDGNIVFASCDTHTLQQSGFTLNHDSNGDGTNDCVIFTTDSTSAYYAANLTSLIKHCSGVSEADAITQTLKGYVEVINEGEFWINPAHAVAACRTAPAHGVSLMDWVTLGCATGNTRPSLMGKVYYADTDLLWPASISRLGDINAYAIPWFTDGSVILHEDTFTAELASPTGPGYAYADPYTAIPATNPGAADINMCFYSAAVGAVPTVNRVGAAATYGPTLADIDYDLGTAYIGRADYGYPVAWQHTVGQVDSLAFDIFQGVDNGVTICMNGGSTVPCYANSSALVMSHFFNLSPLMVTNFVFTFPQMHFINQQAQATEVVAFDTEENDCIIPPGKFISPGLPGSPTFVPEVAVTELETCTSFAEGWRAFLLNVPTDGVGSVAAFHDYYTDAGVDSRVIPVGGYSPLAITFAMTSGDDVFSTSPMTKDPTSTFNITWTDN